MLNLETVLPLSFPLVEGQTAPGPSISSDENPPLFELTLADALLQVPEISESPEVADSEAAMAATAATVAPQLPTESIESIETGGTIRKASEASTPVLNLETRSNIASLTSALARAWNRPLRQDLPGPKEQKIPDHTEPLSDDITPFLIAAAFLAAPEMPGQPVFERDHVVPAPMPAEKLNLDTPGVSIPVPSLPGTQEQVETAATVQSSANFPTGETKETVPGSDASRKVSSETIPLAPASPHVDTEADDLPHTGLHVTRKGESSVERSAEARPTTPAVDETRAGSIDIPHELALTKAVHEESIRTSSGDARVELRESAHAETDTGIRQSTRLAPDTATVPTAQVLSDSPNHEQPSREKGNTTSHIPEVNIAPHSGTRETESRPETRPELHIEIKSDAHPSHVRSMDAVLTDSRTTPLDSAKQTPAASPSEQWTQFEKADVISQLVEKARSLRWDRNSEIVVSLKPESLGRISMRASLVDRTMVATITAESDKVRNLIQVELPAIQRSLHENGIPARVDVSHQANMSLDYNNPSNGQPRFRQAMPNLYQEAEPNTAAGPASKVDVPDSRYSSHSVHLIA